jgi:hypothetical protein
MIFLKRYSHFITVYVAKPDINLYLKGRFINCIPFGDYSVINLYSSTISYSFIMRRSNTLYEIYANISPKYCSVRFYCKNIRIEDYKMLCGSSVVRNLSYNRQIYEDVGNVNFINYLGLSRTALQRLRSVHIHTRNLVSLFDKYKNKCS